MRFELPDVFGPSRWDAGKFVPRGKLGVNRPSDVGVAAAEHEVDKMAVGPFTHRGMAYQAQKLKRNVIKYVADTRVVKELIWTQDNLLER